MQKALAAGLLLLSLSLSGCTWGQPNEAPPQWVPPVYEQINEIGDWPDFVDAKIRPGVQVLVGGGQCTGNFIFRTPDNATLYMGLAAHCLGSPQSPAPVGSPVVIAGIANAGKVAWNLWETNPSFGADLALIELSNAAHVRPFVHPAVLHFGGPTGMADSNAVLTGEYVITYGHSGQRPNGDEDNPREGVVIEHTGDDITVWTDHPGIQGDSGSGLMTSDGLALGVLSRGTTNPADPTVPNDQFPSINYYVELDTLLAQSREALGPLELVTWAQLEGPEIPL